MHYHCEVWIPQRPKKLSELKVLINNIMSQYSYNNDDSCEEKFYDWYVIGGRWSGDHLPEHEFLSDYRNYTQCSCKDTSRSCGYCHGTGMKLKNSSFHKSDVMKLSKVRDDLTCCILIVDGIVYYDDDLKDTPVKKFLFDKGVTSGYLVIVDCHN